MTRASLFFGLVAVAALSAVVSGAGHSSTHGNFLEPCGTNDTAMCSGNLSCVVFNESATDPASLAGFFPVVLCTDDHGDGDDHDHDHSSHGGCGCAQPIVESGECNAAASCNATESCTTAADCEDGSLCMALDTSSSTTRFTNAVCDGEEEGDASCACAKPDTLRTSLCDGDSDCAGTDQRCARVDVLGDERTVCVSCHRLSALKNATEYLGEGKGCDHTGHDHDHDHDKTPTPTPSKSPKKSPNASPEPCVAIDALQGVFEPKDLVFAQHRRAAVLCDAKGSCATAGHFVQVADQHMSMKRYCDLHAPGGCSRKIMFVNSPRMRAGLRFKSRTDGMLFTALAARYNSRAEEWALSAVLRLGL